MNTPVHSVFIKDVVDSRNHINGKLSPHHYDELSNQEIRSHTDFLSKVWLNSCRKKEVQENINKMRY